MRPIGFFIGRFCLQATTLETAMHAERTTENMAMVGRRIPTLQTLSAMR